MWSVTCLADQSVTCLVVCPVNSVTLSGKSGASSGKAEDEGVAGATSRTRTPPGMSSGWREPMVICGTGHLLTNAASASLQPLGIGHLAQAIWHKSSTIWHRSPDRAHRPTPELTSGDSKQTSYSNKPRVSHHTVIRTYRPVLYMPATLQYLVGRCKAKTTLFEGLA